MKKFLKQLFCKHRYERLGWTERSDDGKEIYFRSFREEYDEQRNERYAVRQYQCLKCGKKIWVDGRCDPYSKF